MKTPQEVVKTAVERYGKDAGIHLTYNLMLHERGSPGYKYWNSILKLLKEKHEKERKSAILRRKNARARKLAAQGAKAVGSRETARNEISHQV